MPLGYVGPWAATMRGVTLRFRQVTDADDPFRFLAPATGYQSEFSIAFPDKTEKDFTSDPTYHFWIFDGKHYGVMDVEFKAFHKNRSRLTISYRLSLKEGDRNLQPAE